jgi:hypothetical protein
VKRLNEEGIPRADLLLALRDVKVVREARANDYCLLCRKKGVNEAALCTFCYSMLDGEEMRVAGLWLAGVGP